MAPRKRRASATKATVGAMDTNGTSNDTFWFLPSPGDWQWNFTTSSLGKFVLAEPVEEVAEEERGAEFEGVMAVVGHPTSDGRYLIPGEVGNRDLPIPFMVQTATEEHHAGAECCGRIESMDLIPISDFDRRDEFSLAEVSDDAFVVWGVGTFDSSDHGFEAERMVENGAGVSIDMPPDRVAAFDPDTLEEIPEEEVDFEALMSGAYLIGIGGKIAAATIVSIPAFEEASIVLVPGHALVASAFGIKLKESTVLTAAAAGAAPLKPPKNWFFTEEPDHPVPLTITPEGAVFGHLALWNQCHSAFASCERAPASRTDYSYFHVGEIETAEGDLIGVGRITVGEAGNAKGGHASVVLGRQGAVEHYDKTGCVGAFVRAENGKNGIWLSGAVRSDAPAERVRDMRANPPSGDWRDDELVGVLSVPVPGLAIPRVQALIASAENGNEEVRALIATGYMEEAEDAEVIDMPTYRRKLEELKSRRVAVLESS